MRPTWPGGVFLLDSRGVSTDSPEVECDLWALREVGYARYTPSKLEVMPEFDEISRSE
jgi:hypothetical protein